MLNIFSEYEIKNLKLKNRIVMPPMCMYVAPETGMVTDWHVIHYATRAVGGTGLIIVEATAIAPEGRISAKDLGIWEDAHIPGLARIVNSVHENGAKIGIQLNHAGRKCTVKGMEIEAPSPIPYDEQSEIPKEMTKTDIDETVDEFRRAAIRANKAGFDLLQIHAAHGYLLSEFLSPLTNNREDEYGGSYENIESAILFFVSISYRSLVAGIKAYFFISINFIGFTQNKLIINRILRKIEQNKQIVSLFRILPLI
jgi:NADPH2 dehydrogenase